MAQTAGINYSSNAANCRAINSEACTAAGYTYSYSYNCYSSGGAYQRPTACLIGTVDPCPTCPTTGSGSTVSVDWSLTSLDSGTTAYIFGGAVFLWATGLGIGLIISVIRRTRI